MPDQQELEFALFACRNGSCMCRRVFESIRSKAALRLGWAASSHSREDSCDLTSVVIRHPDAVQPQFKGPFGEVVTAAARSC
jgi:hypothetical protein